MNTKKFLLIISLFLLRFAFAQDQTTVNLTDSMPGILVDGGGHKLHLNVQGKGSPTIVFENGSGDFSFIWALVQPEVAKFTQTVSYDRAGFAWSEPGPMPRTSEQICFELHTALNNAGIHPPYILVGQSFGGFLVRAFARYYPKEVAGMVLVEAVQEDQKIFMGGDTPQRIRDAAKGRVAPAVQTNFTPQRDTSQQQPAAQPMAPTPLGAFPYPVPVGYPYPVGYTPYGVWPYPFPPVIGHFSAPRWFNNWPRPGPWGFPHPHPGPRFLGPPVPAPGPHH